MKVCCCTNTNCEDVRRAVRELMEEWDGNIPSDLNKQIVEKSRGRSYKDDDCRACAKDLIGIAAEQLEIIRLTENTDKNPERIPLVSAL